MVLKEVILLLLLLFDFTLPKAFHIACSDAGDAVSVGYF